MIIKFYITGFKQSKLFTPEIVGNLIFYDDNNNQYCWLSDNPISFSFTSVEKYEKWKIQWENIIVWPERKEE